jgi:hypothetical protein
MNVLVASALISRIFAPSGVMLWYGPLGPRPSKLENHANMGWFLGYIPTIIHACYMDECTLKVKTISRARFVGGMKDSTNPPQNARQLHAALKHTHPQDNACKNAHRS